jgi:hypothetical protein
MDRTTEPLRAQLVEAFETTTFPVRRPTALLSAMANGRGVFVVDDVELVALELALTCGESLSFPYETVDDIVDDIVAALRRSLDEPRPDR